MYILSFEPNPLKSTLGHMGVPECKKKKHCRFPTYMLNADELHKGGGGKKKVPLVFFYHVFGALFSGFFVALVAFAQFNCTGNQRHDTQ